MNNKHKKNQRLSKSFLVEYNETLQGIVLNILDRDGMYPCYWRDPEAGIYKIIKTASGKLLMSK